MTSRSRASFRDFYKAVREKTPHVLIASFRPGRRSTRAKQKTRPAKHFVLKSRSTKPFFLRIPRHLKTFPDWQRRKIWHWFLLNNNILLSSSPSRSKVSKRRLTDTKKNETKQMISRANCNTMFLFFLTADNQISRNVHS